MKLPSVLLADDHTIIADGLRSLLEGHANVLGSYRDGQALMSAILHLNPDVVVTDLSMPRLTGFEVLRKLKETRSPTRVVVLSMYADQALVTSALHVGARAYIPKHAAGDELVGAISEVMAGRIYLSPLIGPQRPRATPAHGMRPPSQLTPRQREVLRLVAAGKRMKEIAAELNLSRRTVEMHKYDMMRVLGLSTTAELIQYFVKHEVFTESEPAP